MRNEPEARIWATVIDLAGTNQERRRYYLAIEDNGERIDVELIFGPNKAMAVEPFVPRELDYTVHDFCNHEDDYCVLEDEGTQEYEDNYLNEARYWDMHRKKDDEVAG